VSGVAAAKLPPSPKKTSTLPSRIARSESTVSHRGHAEVEAELVAQLSRNSSGSFSQTPIVRSPCTLLCPRTGQVLLPGRPMFPRSERKLTISRIVATAIAMLGQAIASRR